MLENTEKSWLTRGGREEAKGYHSVQDMAKQREDWVPWGHRRFSCRKSGWEGRTGTVARRRQSLNPVPQEAWDSAKEDLEARPSRGNSLYKAGWYEVHCGCVSRWHLKKPVNFKTLHKDFHIISFVTFSEPQFPHLHDRIIKIFLSREN